jgi:O-antigen ligase
MFYPIPVKASTAKPSIFNLSLIPLICTIIITPGLNTEVQVLGKATFLTIATFLSAIFYLLFRRKKSLTFDFDFKWKALFSLTFLGMLVTIFFNRDNISEQIFGVYGRNNGLLTYAALFILMILAYANSNSKLGSLIVSRLALANSIVVSYFFIQYFDFDFISWVQLYSTPVSTIGNPNFLSSFIAFSTFAHIANSVDLKLSVRIRALSFVGILSSLALLLITNSIQGYALVCIGLFIKLFFYFVRQRKKDVVNLLLGAVSVGIITLAFGLAGVSPAARIFQFDSLAIRKEYWSAGIKIFLNSPWIGTGLDSYLYFFDQFKSSRFVMRYGESLVASSSHNVYIDIFQGAGLLTGVPYLVLNSWILLESFKRIKTFRSDTVYETAFIVWVLIQLQSLISIQTISISAWQWIIGGYLIGVSRNLSRTKKSETNPSKARNQFLAFQKVKFIGPIFICCSAAALAFLPLVQDIRFANAIKNSSGSALIDLAQSFPYDTYRMNYTSRALQDARYWYWAIEVAKKSVTENPRNKEAWRIILESKLTTQYEKNLAKARLLKIDPSWTVKT